MIGRSLIIFQLGNDKNELHEVGLFLLSTHYEREHFKNGVIKNRINDKWKPDEIVNDEEVEAICNAKHLGNPKSPGYHKWASDQVFIVNISNDPNLYNPLVPIQNKRKAENEKRAKAMKKLESFLPELSKLRKDVPTGEIEIDYVIYAKVRVSYGVGHYENSCIEIVKDGQRADSHQLIDRNALATHPEVAAIINCPFKKAYQDRCNEIATQLGLTETDVENETYFYGTKCPKCREYMTCFGGAGLTEEYICSNCEPNRLPHKK